METPIDSIDTVVQFKLYFEDDTTANFTMNGIDVEKLNLGTIKTSVRAFNADPSEYSNLMVSKAGAPWVGISAVTVTTTSREYIF